MKTIAETSLGGLAPVLIVEAVKTIVTIAVLSEKITEVGDSVTKLVAKGGKLETKVDVKFEVLGSMEARLNAKVDKLESKMDAKVDKLESRLDANFNMLTTRLDTLVAQGVQPRRK